MDGGSEEEVGILTIVNLVYTALMNNLRLLLWEQLIKALEVKGRR